MAYLKLGQLRVKVMGRGIAWLDTGTHESLLQASTFIQAVEERQGSKLRARKRSRTAPDLLRLKTVLRSAHAMGSNGYGTYLRQLVEDDAAVRNELR